MICSKHKKYQALRAPRAACIACWLGFLEKNPDVEMSGKVVYQILRSISQQLEEITANVHGAAGAANAALYVANLGR